MAQIQLRTYQQILGNMISTLLAQTDLNDLSPGSVFLTLLEAAASSDFTQEGKLLQLINLNDVDKTKGTDLENLATQLGVTPPRQGATSSNVQVTITDTAFNKISTNVYAGTISPAAGDMTLNVVSASTFTASGTIYIGRGTATSESVAYATKTNNGNYWILSLSSPLAKNHFVGEEVVLAQGGDRTVQSGSIVQVPAASGSPAIQFSTTIDITISDGENKYSGVSATAVTPGSSGNVGLNKINQFQAPPFSTAAVTNDQTPASGGQDTETDSQLRQRIKDYVHNIGKGTETAIISTVIGVSDPDQGDRVVSAFLREPTTTGALAILYIDDGTGFQPTFAGIGVENIISNAIGTEQFIQLQNFPIVKAQEASIGTEPFDLVGGERLRFVVDGVAEEQPLANTQYRTPGVVLAQEIVQTINAIFTTVEARAKNGQIFVTPIEDEPDYIQCVAASSNDANAVIRFPVNKQHTLRLFENNVLLNKNGSLATIQSFPNTSWPTFASTETIQLKIDGINSPVITFTDALFASLTSSLTIASAGPNDWATIFNDLVIGITATAQTDGTFIVSSNKGEISAASISVVGGSLSGRLISSTASSVGISSQYTLNRLLGQVELAQPMPANGQLNAGTTLTQGFVKTSAQAVFSLNTTLGTAPMIVMVTDAPGSILPVSQTVGTLTYSTSTTAVQRITGTTGQFSFVLPDDWGFFYNLSIAGFVRVLDVAGNGSFVDVLYPEPLASGTDTPDGLTKQFVFFRTTGLPQQITLPSGASVAGSAIIASINSQLSGGIATQLDNNVIQVATQRLDGSAALFIAIMAGTANNLGFIAGNYPNNDPELATEESGDLAGYPTGRLTIATDDTSLPYDTFTANGTPFSHAASNDHPILNYNGAQAKLIRIPLQVNSSSSLTLREDPPLQIDPIGKDIRAVQTHGMQFGQTDDMVFIMDNNPTEETFDIPMYVNATIASPTVPSTTQFDAADATGALLGVSARWAGMRFEDYRVWFQPRVDLAHSGSNDQIRITSVPFGPAGKTFQFGIFYPNSASSTPAATFIVDSTDGLILINLILGSSAARSIGLVPSTLVKVSSTGPVGSTYTWTIRFVPPVSLGTVLVGDIVSLTDPNFNAANLIQFKVASITNLSDSTRSYQFLQETFTGCSISGGNSFILGSMPTQALSSGDQLLITGIQTNATVVGTNTITVATGGDYATGGGSLTILSSPYTYTAYNSGTGVFTGVTPNPSGIVVAGNAILQSVSTTATFVNTVGSTTTGTVSPSFYTTTGSFFNMTLTHAAITANGAPSFSVSPGDIIQVASQTLTVQTVVSSTIYTVDSPFSFTGLQAGVVSRILLTGTKTTAAVTQSILTSSSTGVQVIPLNAGTNTASSLISIVNNTAGVNELVTASNSPSSNGSGVISSSTEDLLANASIRSGLLNGESWVYSTNSSSPGLTLKVPLDFAPTIGDPIRLVPVTPQNIRDHFNRNQISGLSNAAQISLVNGARRVQVSSLTPGAVGQVFAVGGKASGNNAIDLVGVGQQISSTVGVIELDQSALNLLNPGHLVYLSQPGRAKKNYPGTQPSSGTTAQIQTVSSTTGQLTFGVPLVVIETYTHTGSVIWLVRQLPRGRLRFEVFSGTASLPGALQADDWVFVGDGTSYAGVTPVEFFAGANKGYFQIRETDASTYFDVDAVGFEQYVTCTSAPFVFFTYHSARIGDQLVIANNSPFNTANQGTFLITAVVSTTVVQYVNPLANNQGPTALGSGGVTSIGVLDQGYSTYRTVTTLAPNPSDPTNTALIVLNPGYNISLLNQGQGAVLTLPNRLNFSSEPVPGISAYQYWTGLKRTVQRTVDGYAPDQTDFPGVRAAGVAIEVREPQIQQVSMSIQITTNQGVSLSAISDTIISSVVGYINSLGLGQSVILSQIVSIIQAVSGVQSVVLTDPVLQTELITIKDNAIARTSSTQIILTTTTS